MGFQASLQFGRIAENKIAVWLRARGNSITPVYDIETEDANKGPRIYSLDGELIAPDLLAFNKTAAFWIEAKRKTRFTWHRLTATWQTGIDVVCYEHYLKLAKASPFPLWLLFLHEESHPDPRDLREGCPGECPTGLYGDDIITLSEIIDHRHSNWGRRGMVYWTVETLKLIATVDDVNRTIDRAGRKPIVRAEVANTNRLKEAL